jgi:acetoacetyl-CoA synthetase
VRISLQQLSSSKIVVLADIWQRVLRRSSTQIEDNFFEIGGDPSFAVQLFAEIGNLVGLHYPPEFIYQFPTIASLTALLELPSPLVFPQLALLKSGTAPPVFFVHGLGGSVFEFFHLVKHLSSAHAFYGLHVKGMDGIEQPLERIEDMAQFHLEAIRRVQPHGPYFLVGYSLGGLITIEIARCLLEAGEKLELLAMLDAYPHRRYLPPGQHAKLIFRLIGRRAFSGIRRLAPGSDSSSELRNARSLNGRGAATSTRAIQERIRHHATRALENYRPKFFPGKIRFIRAATPTEFPVDPAAVWTNLFGALSVETTPGDHESMLTAHSASLGDILSRYLLEVSEPKNS